VAKLTVYFEASDRYFRGASRREFQSKRYEKEVDDLKSPSPK